MSRYTNLFKQCAEQHRIAFIPFVMLGDPSFETSKQIIRQLIESGADALELGIPFSDPVADGPVIQGAAIRALENGMTTERAFELLSAIRNEFPDIAIGLLLYANLVYHKGIQHFYQKCSDIGIDSVLIADVPIRESELFDSASLKVNVDPVHILPPNPSEQTVMQVAQKSRGYTYVLGRAGVTGIDVAAQMPAREMIQQLNDYDAAPPVMGFGISKPEQVEQAREVGFKGAISGSAVVRIIEQNLSNKQSLLEQLHQFVTAMLKATYSRP